ncbi:MAG: hypothetical protein QM569_12390 [Acidovorax sp.]|uniref:hypothetical protein n=1 Tax=Acidovorax sp. TaxID=1872122 RepID=UPI0039E6F0A1
MPVFLSSLLHFIWTALIPLTGLVLTALLVLYALYVRAFRAPQKWLLAPRALQALCGVAGVGMALLLLNLYLDHSAHQARQDGAVVRAGRERFVLPRDYQYGELLIPQGSLINRKDPFDKGEPDRPLALHGLEAVRFAQPVEVAGVWASAMQTVPARVELARDQSVGPVYRFNSASQAWELHKLVPALACKKGQIAVFQVPHIPYDVQAELGKPAPDGPQARFLPSQWMLRNCENGPPISVEPAAPR